jgi:acyl-CoA thioester hydrolase
MLLDKFSIEMEVRDNELDAQGIVNNANYMIYLSHARHKHGEALSINHTDFAQENMNLIITSCTMKFKNPLKANDKFIVTSKITEADLPYHWAHKQDIKRLSDGKIILKAVFNATCVNINAERGANLFIPEQIKQIMK